MQRYAIVFFPKVNVEKLQVFRKKYDPLWNILDPHITMVFPFSGISEEQIVQHLETIAKHIQPFQINMNGFMKSFDDYLFLLVNGGKEKVFVLHDKLYTGILSSYLRSDIPFIPHITLGLFRTTANQFEKELYTKAYAEAETLGLDIHCIFNNMSLIKGDGLTPAKIIQSFDFT